MGPVGGPPDLTAPDLAVGVLVGAVRRERTHDGQDAALQELLPVAPGAAKEFYRSFERGYAAATGTA
jgi:hypothetical protein